MANLKSQDNGHSARPDDRRFIPRGHPPQGVDDGHADTEERSRPGHGTARRDAPHLGHDLRQPGATDEGGWAWGSCTNPAFLFRSLIGRHIAGFSATTVQSKTRLPPFVRTVVRDFTQMTIGQEVTEESEDGNPDQGPAEPELIPVREHAEADVRDRHGNWPDRFWGCNWLRHRLVRMAKK